MLNMSIYKYVMDGEWLPKHMENDCSATKQTLQYKIQRAYMRNLIVQWEEESGGSPDGNDMDALVQEAIDQGSQPLRILLKPLLRPAELQGKYKDDPRHNPKNCYIPQNQDWWTPHPWAHLLYSKGTEIFFL